MPKRILTAEQATEIKQMIIDRVPLKDIAARFGVSGATITYIKQGRIWRDCGPRNAIRVVRTCRHCKGRGMVVMPMPPAAMPKLRIVPISMPKPAPKPAPVIKPMSMPVVKPKPPKRDRLLAALMSHHAPKRMEG